MTITPRSHWESINTQRKLESKKHQGILRKWFGRSPARDIFYKITDRFFEINPEKSVLEVGCAPGKRLLEFAERYKYIPYGVEYSKSGIECAITEFRDHGIPENQCIYSDVFDERFQNMYKNKFDVVISFGFIEHFTNIREVIDAHLNLLKPNGTLLIMIPNLRGIYYPIMKLLAPDLIHKHNLSIMKKDALRNLFINKEVIPLFCGYYGVINFGILQGEGRIKTLIIKILQFIQIFLNPILRKCHYLENHLTSPYMLYICRKK